jgi:ATP-dependent 26S proteasome regulatory subunit
MQVTYVGTKKAPAQLNSPIEVNLSLKHLLAELARIDLLLQRQIQRWQEAGQDPGDAFRGLYVSDQEAQALISRPVSSHWGDTISGDNHSQADPFAQALQEASLQAHALAEAARHQNHPPRLSRLIETFGLQPFDVDALLICLAPQIDLRYERIYGYLQDDVTRKLPTINLVLGLLCPPGAERILALRHFSLQGPLFSHRLLERPADEPRNTLLNQVLTIDRTVAAWLLGDYQPPTQPGLRFALSAPAARPSDPVIAGESVLNPQKIIAKKPILAFYGPDSAAQLAAARLLAQEAKRPLLEVRYQAEAAGETSAAAALDLALRDARLTDALPFLHGWDSALEDAALPAGMFAELCTFPGLLIFSTAARWLPKGYEHDRRIAWQEFPTPSYARRIALWQHFLGQAEPLPDVENVAGQFQLNTGQIQDAVASARNLAAQHERRIQPEDLLVAARSHSNPRLGALALKINPHYRWDDIILPDDQRALLRELVATVRERPQVLDAWGVGRKLVPNRGVTVLFAGPPGTGKTMSAEIIAAELGLDLYKIDLSTIVSKYIGETEKNMERIFQEAETSNAILFFDEADALFGKRSEVKDSHDRYANIEISYLLQRMEAYDGVTILATNLRANLDEAFTRRLQFAVDFPFPEQADRLRIWQTLFPPDVPRAANLDFEMLARRFKLAGGNIRNVIVNAAYLAAANGSVVTMEHLLHGTRRELQKMGRLIGEQDLSQ